MSKQKPCWNISIIHPTLKTYLIPELVEDQQENHTLRCQGAKVLCRFFLKSMCIIYMYIYIYVYVYICIYICIYIYTYIYIYIYYTHLLRICPFLSGSWGCSIWVPFAAEFPDLRCADGAVSPCQPMLAGMQRSQVANGGIWVPSW